MTSDTTKDRPTARPSALLVAVLGAESTGKTTLTQGLALALALDQPDLQAANSGATTCAPLRTAWVPEVLRQWCDSHGRAPQAHEQAHILEEQHARINAAATAHDVVVCDTTGLMTAVYSGLIFGDHSLDPRALQLHSQMDLSLLTALDLPWVPDGHQRDGPQVREPVDAAIRALLLNNGLPFAVIGGRGAARLTQARAAVAPLLQRLRPPAPTGSTEATGVKDATDATDGLFTRLQTGGGSATGWACECCGDAPYERALRGY